LAVAVLLSPLLLAGLRQLSPDSGWETLSYIGQTYGAIAAILTALSLLALVWSIRLQSRGLEVQTEQVARAHYIDLVTLALQNPNLLPGSPWGPSAEPAMVYAGLWMAHWRGLYVLGYMPEDELRIELTGLFRVSPLARQRWTGTREFWRAGNLHGKDRRFFEIVEESLATAVASDTVTPPAPEVAPGKEPGAAENESGRE
jgi:hypothetical protein